MCVCARACVCVCARSHICVHVCIWACMYYNYCLELALGIQRIYIQLYSFKYCYQVHIINEMLSLFIHQIKARIDKTQQKSKWRLSCDRDETIDHIVKRMQQISAEGV